MYLINCHRNKRVEIKPELGRMRIVMDASTVIPAVPKKNVDKLGTVDG